MGKKKQSLVDQVRAAMNSHPSPRSWLATASGVDEGALSRFARGLTGLSADGLEKLADAMGYEIVFQRKG